MELPRAPLERIMRNAGAERVSGDAVEALRSEVEDVAKELANEAVQASKHADRKTIKRDDVHLASH
ncbi:MAG: histone family protein [Candidatus Nanohaloarchaeota archaeon QJJ-9]|nr:histone family protein [Candidatus Nanohaloarchaeota archaeon QJJ-9]